MTRNFQDGVFELKSAGPWSSRSRIGHPCHRVPISVRTQCGPCIFSFDWKELNCVAFKDTHSYILDISYSTLETVVAPKTNHNPAASGLISTDQSW